MTMFRCSSPRCAFEALVPNAPDHADAMKCPACGDKAVADLPGRPAFRCERCSNVFRASGSTRDVEPCGKCGGRGVRAGSSSKAGTAAAAAPATVVLSKAEMKALGARLAAAFWTATAGEGARQQGYGVCDACNGNVEVGGGFLTGPLSSDDPFPSLFCGACWDRSNRRPWDGDTSRMPPHLSRSWQPVLDALPGSQCPPVPPARPAPPAPPVSAAPRVETTATSAAAAPHARQVVSPAPARTAPEKPSPTAATAVPAGPAVAAPQTGQTKESARSAAVAYWQSSTMEIDRQAGLYPCECCQTPMPVNAGCAVKPGSGHPVQIDLTAIQARTSLQRCTRLGDQIAELAAEYKQARTVAGTDTRGLEGRARALLEEAPADTRLLLMLGVMAFQADRYEEARTFFAQASVWAPCDAVLHFHLGCVHEKLGRFDRALRDYDRARRLDFTFNSARKAYYRLERQQHPMIASPGFTRQDAERLLQARQYEDLVVTGDAAIPGLVAILSDQRSQHLHRTVATVLSRLGEPAVPALISFLEKDRAQFKFRMEILDALSLIASPAAVRYLRQALRSVLQADKFDHGLTAAVIRTGDLDGRMEVLQLFHSVAPTWRMNVSQVLLNLPTMFVGGTSFDVVALPDGMVAETLLETARTEVDPTVRRFLVRGLIITQSPTAPRIAAGLLKSSDLRLRQDAAWTLQRLAEQHVPCSLTGHECAPPGKRGDVWDISEWMGNEGAIAALIGALANPAPEVRQSAGMALGHLGDLALPALVEASRTAGPETKEGLGWASQTIHVAGRRILMDCDLARFLHRPTTGLHQVGPCQPGGLPGDASLNVPHPMRSLYLPGRTRSVQCMDADELQVGTNIEVLSWEIPASNSSIPSGLRITNEVQTLNQSLPNAWKAMKFKVDQCRGCGIEMPVEEEFDFMNLQFLQLVQNNSQAVRTTIAVTQNYYAESTGPNFSNALLARFDIFHWAQLKKCERCQGWICKRCEKVTHDEGGCRACTYERMRRDSLPELVCERCFDRRGFIPWSPTTPSEVTTAAAG